MTVTQALTWTSLHQAQSRLCWRRCMAWKLTLTVTVTDYTVLTTQMTKTTTTPSGFLDVIPFHLCMVQNKSEHLSPATYCQQHCQQHCWHIAGNCSVFFPYFVPYSGMLPVTQNVASNGASNTHIASNIASDAFCRQQGRQQRPVLPVMSPAMSPAMPCVPNPASHCQ